MKDFKEVLERLQDDIYRPCDLVVEDLVKEDQNKDYYGCRFKIHNRQVRFRVAKLTPNKIGQFVSFWEKNDRNKNVPYAYEKSPDLVVVTCFFEERIGQFIFPKKILLEKGILRDERNKGKMGIRLYPSWDLTDSSQAKKTQEWQKDYFVEIKHWDETRIKRIKDLYL